MRAVIALLCLAPLALAAPPESSSLHHYSVRTPVLELLEGKAAVITLHGTLKDKGAIKLSLDPNPHLFDETGSGRPVSTAKVLVIDCMATYVKTTKTPRLNPPRTFIERRLYQLKGMGLKSKMFLLGPAAEGGAPRMLIQDKYGKVTHVFEFQALDISPCHPGCFPAGTPVVTPKGPRPVERIRVGDEVTTVGEDGKAGVAKVQSVFVTTNKLLKVETAAGTLLTTPTQPLVRTDGTVVPTEELRAGDEIWRWEGGKRVAARVVKVGPSERVEKVFNLVLGGSEVFIAGGHLARSKSPLK
jgi:hypothetical protein